ncbi:MAG: enolase C-terminal domain-like protein, partial [Bradyrhizobium sp.]
DFMAALLGHVRGGLQYVLLGAMFLVSGISGSKAADMAAIAPALFPEMKKRGSKPEELVALLSSSGAMTETIPPSLVLITIGAVCSVSITALFIGGLMPAVIGQDPHRIEFINAVLGSRSVQSRGGIVRQAIGAIENALLDIKGKDLGVPVYQLFGGKVRDRLPVYWSHCGSYRMRNAELVGEPVVRTYDDMTRVGAEVKAKGFGALKTNIAIEIDGLIQAYRPGFVVGRGFPERNWDAFIARSAAKTVEAFRKGCGPDVGIMLDTNFHFRTEGFRRIAEAVGPTGLTWLELDAHDPKSIALIRRDSPCPIASGETLLERRDFRPYLEAYAFDTAIVDVVWNGFYESLKIAAMAEVYEVNVAPHNFYGHLASAISAHFCAAVPNFRIMEIDID